MMVSADDVLMKQTMTLLLSTMMTLLMTMMLVKLLKLMINLVVRGDDDVHGVDAAVDDHQR